MSLLLVAVVDAGDPVLNPDAVRCLPGASLYPVHAHVPNTGKLRPPYAKPQDPFATSQPTTHYQRASHVFLKTQTLTSLLLFPVSFSRITLFFTQAQKRAYLDYHLFFLLSSPNFAFFAFSRAAFLRNIILLPIYRLKCYNQQ